MGNYFIYLTLICFSFLNVQKDCVIPVEKVVSMDLFYFPNHQNIPYHLALDQILNGKHTKKESITSVGEITRVLKGCEDLLFYESRESSIDVSVIIIAKTKNGNKYTIAFDNIYRTVWINGNEYFDDNKIYNKVCQLLKIDKLPKRKKIQNNR